LFTLQRLAHTHPAMVQHFREASLKGWGYALQHPDEVAARILAELRMQAAVSDAAGFTRYQTEVARELARYPDVPLGHSNRERWSRIQQSLIEVGEITRPADLNAFLYNPDATVQNPSDRQAAIVAVAAVATLLAGAGLLWWWGQGRGATPTGAAAGGGDAKSPGLPAPPISRVPGEMRRKLTAVGTQAVNRLRKVRSRLSQQPRFARLAAAVAEKLERLKSGDFGMRSRLARLRAAVASVPSRLASVTRQSAESAAGARPTDLNATLTTLERSIRRGLPGSVKCRLSLVPEPWLCHTDPDAIAAATVDLVAAAVADMPAGGDLILGTRQYAIDEAEAAELAGSAPGNYVRLTVRDNGAGLSSEHLDRIFDPAATARPAVASAGELARRLGGFARVESAEGIGTAVHLYFRRVVAAGTGAQHPPESEERAKAAAA